MCYSCLRTWEMGLGAMSVLKLYGLERDIFNLFSLTGMGILNEYFRAEKELF